MIFSAKNARMPVIFDMGKHRAVSQAIESNLDLAFDNLGPEHNGQNVPRLSWHKEFWPINFWALE